MSRICQICGKRPSVGNRVTRRGRAKYLGGVGRKITGSSKRQFKPNLQRVRALKDGTVTRIRVCTKCIRSGKVVKPSVRPKFDADGKPMPIAMPVQPVVEEVVVEEVVELDDELLDEEQDLEEGAEAVEAGDADEQDERADD